MKMYEELANFIAKAAGPEKLAAFRPSKAVSKRVESLTQKHKDGALSKTERDELDHYVKIEHVMRMAKARSHRVAASA
jgi:hypothetical protein